jgi:hypothetical protein
VKYDDKNSDYLTQTVRAGRTATEPTPPYHAGSTFKGWYTNATPSDTDPAYVFATPVNGHLDLFAVYDIPTVVIGGYVKCDADGAQNGAGGYYRMMNLTVRGFRPTGTPINSVTLTVENSVIAFYPTDSVDDYEVLNSIDAATGNGSVSIIFTGAGGLTMAEVQQFLRTNVIVQVKDTSLNHRMRVTVYGMTSYRGGEKSDEDFDENKINGYGDGAWRPPRPPRAPAWRARRRADARHGVYRCLPVCAGPLHGGLLRRLYRAGHAHRYRKAELERRLQGDE